MDIDISCMTWLPIICGQLRRLFVPKHTISHLLLLPDDIIINIFSRLDAECAFQCLRLCRSLSTILSSPYFLSVHCFQSAPSLLVQCFEWQPMLDKSSVYGRDVVLHCIGESENTVALRVKFKSSYVWPEFDSRPLLVGSYNGLLLFINHSLFHSAFFIWNPLTQEQVTLIAPEPVYNVCGFYFHPPTREYRVLYMRYRSSDSDFYVLSLGANLLREIPNCSRVPCTRRPPVILNGALHWTVSENLSNTVCHTSSSSLCTNLILVFKIESEVFSSIPHPEIEKCSSKRHCHMHLLELEGKLGLCDVTLPTDFHVWVLQEKHVWVKMHKISTKSVVPKQFHYFDSNLTPALEALYIHNDELLLKSHYRRLYSYHLKRKTFRAIDTSCFGWKILTSTIVHFNSMASLHTDEIIFLDNLELQEL
ncbi:hypothetical protein FRX31_003013 [Thalictrum thalictroides]|uniref:F-box domain-containing protein n=1 Tax=Thalictrum thalictroides TaxID=46969 RepID=A0A7J6XG30_THATH|nr:hypothetical protein FRX31_003013 [Thalictrum thalictroides]